MRRTQEAVITVWGDFACWTHPEAKVERLTSAVPTPCGIRGLLSAIYSKSAEFYWQVKRIEVLRPIRFMTIRRNEVKTKYAYTASNPMKGCIDIEEDRTQRQSVVLRDVRYRITAEMVLRDSYPESPERLYRQFERRVKHGQNFFQPCMGTREFPAYYEWGSTGEAPIDETMDLGIMVYDTFDLHSWQVTKKPEPCLSLFRAEMVQGVIEVPPYDDPRVLKPGKGVL